MPRGAHELGLDGRAALVDALDRDKYPYSWGALGHAGGDSRRLTSRSHYPGAGLHLPRVPQGGTHRRLRRTHALGQEQRTHGAQVVQPAHRMGGAEAVSCSGRAH